MISIIIISKDGFFLNQVKKSIELTIGVDFEIISIDNSNANLSIFEGYNICATKAKFNFLVFVHEDIVFHSQNWGVDLINYFEGLKNPGILGVAGSSYLPISPSDWWLSDKSYLYANFLSNVKNGKIGEGKLLQMGTQKSQPVFALDGMFLAIKKIVWEEFPFDESMVGFHGYDTSICYTVSQKYQNYFVPGLLMEHFSKGYPNKIWLKNTVIANQTVLDFIIQIKEKDKIDRNLEKQAFRLFLRQLIKFGGIEQENISLAWKYFKLVRRYVNEGSLYFLLILFFGKFSLLYFKK